MTIDGSVRVTVCGTGAGGQVLAGIMPVQANVEVCVFTTNAQKVSRWQEIVPCGQLCIVGEDGTSQSYGYRDRHFAITDDPQSAARGCDVLLFVLPAFLHRRYLCALAPHLEEGCVIVGLPGQPGFEFEVNAAASGCGRSFPIINFESLPWVCRIVEFGRKVFIKGTKAQLAGAVAGDLTKARIKDPLALLRQLFGQRTELNVSGHVLAITLRSPNASNHPPMMYSQWKDWDGTTLDVAPLFYQGIDEEGSDLVERVNQEVLATAASIMSIRPDVDLLHVIPQYEWEIACYGKDIADSTNLMTSLRTNSGYAGITHPMVELAPGRYAPDFGHRFLSEDIPYGLAVLRGVAEIAGIPTPNIDLVLEWGQRKLGRSYLEGGALTGKDLGATRCPQRYGMSSVEELLGDVLTPQQARSIRTAVELHV